MDDLLVSSCKQRGLIWACTVVGPLFILVYYCGVLMVTYRDNRLVMKGNRVVNTAF